MKFGTGGNYATYQVDSIEGPGSSLKDYPEGNMGHRPAMKGGYFPVPPVDGDSDLRAEMLSTMGEMGLAIENTTTRSRSRSTNWARVRHADDDGRPNADLQILRP